jgi:hypothetical protein
MHRPATLNRCPFTFSSHIAALYRRKLQLKAKFEIEPSYLSFKSIDPGAVNTGFIGSTCTAVPCANLWPRRT